MTKQDVKLTKKQKDVLNACNEHGIIIAKMVGVRGFKFFFLKDGVDVKLHHSTMKRLYTDYAYKIDFHIVPFNLHKRIGYVLFSKEFFCGGRYDNIEFEKEVIRSGSTIEKLKEKTP